MRIVVTGATGQLGSYLIERLSDRPHEIVAWSGGTSKASGKIKPRPIELTDSLAVSNALADVDPDVIIHAAAVSSAEAARRDPGRTRAVNIEATQLIAAWAAKNDGRLVYTSTDLVFDGEKGLYGEDDPPHPTVLYGQTKLAGERFIEDVPRGLVARLSLLYGPSRCERIGFFDRAVAALRAGTPQNFFEDEFRTPLDYSTAASILVRLAESETRGIIHVGGPERLSRFELMCRVAGSMCIDATLVKANRRADAPMPEPRPADASLNITRLRRTFNDLRLPNIEEALAAMSKWTR